MTVPGLEQRELRLHFSDHQLGRYNVGVGGEIVARIPAGIWNRSTMASLRFEFPNAATPKSIGLSEDSRLLAFASGESHFRRPTRPSNTAVCV